MQFGLALPHYDFSVPGESPLRFETIAAHASAAEALGFDSLWVSDHVSLSIERYGGPPGEQFAYEPLATLAALSGVVSRARLGTLVLSEALRPAGVLAKALATLDRVCRGRLDIGIGAGWYEPDYAAVGMALPPPGERLARLREALAVLDAVPLEHWRTGRLVGTVEQLAEQVAGWAELGVAELIVSAGPLPFSISGLEDLELLKTALSC